MRRPRLVRVSLLLLPLVPLVLLACDRPVVPEVTPEPITVQSASSFAVEVAFDRPLAPASASDVAHYVLVQPTGGRVSPARAMLADSLFGQTVLLFFPLGTLEDSTKYSLTASGIQDAWGRPLWAADSTTEQFETGLWYSRPIRALLARKCNPCHNGARAGGNYRTDSYAALFGDGSDANSNPRPNLVPGDARSLIVIRTSPRHSMFNVAHLSYAESQLFINWVVTFQARQ